MTTKLIIYPTTNAHSQFIQCCLIQQHYMQKPLRQQLKIYSIYNLVYPIKQSNTNKQKKNTFPKEETLLSQRNARTRILPYHRRAHV